MVTFFKVVCSPKNILKTIPLALLLLFVTALWPVGIACSNGFCTYRYGFFAWLELIRMDEQPMKNRILFHVMQGADGFFCPFTKPGGQHGCLPFCRIADLQMPHRRWKGFLSEIRRWTGASRA